MSPITARLTMLSLCSLAACASSSQQVLLNAVEARFSGQYHKCVPLGWNPLPVEGSYVPSYSVEFREPDAWLPPLWLGLLPRSAMTTPSGRTAAKVLDALARSGLVAKRYANDGIRYNLTERAVPYYFEGNDFGNNPDHLSYLCYSRLVPDRVVSSRTAGRLAFSWHASEDDDWARDAVIQSHSVILAPTRSPASIILGSWDGELSVDRAAYQPIDRLVQPAAWQLGPPAATGD